MSLEPAPPSLSWGDEEMFEEVCLVVWWCCGSLEREGDGLGVISRLMKVVEAEELTSLSCLQPTCNVVSGVDRDLFTAYQGQAVALETKYKYQ